MPSVISVGDVEEIRDGGSLALFFEEANSGSPIFFLALQKRRHPDGAWENLGFGLPHLITPYRGERDTDTMRHSILSGPAVEVTWDEARSIVQQAAALLSDLTSWRAEWLDALQYAVATDGGLPQSYSRGGINGS